MTEGQAAGTLSTSQPQCPSPMAFPLPLLFLPWTLLLTTLFSPCQFPCHHQLGLDPPGDDGDDGGPMAFNPLKQGKV